jgi:hypothetical protein
MSSECAWVHVNVGGCEYTVYYVGFGATWRAVEVRESCNNHLVTHADPMYEVVVCCAYEQC